MSHVTRPLDHVRVRRVIRHSRSQTWNLPFCGIAGCSLCRAGSMAPKKRKAANEAAASTPKAKPKPASKATPKPTPRARSSNRNSNEVLSEMTAPFPCKNLLEMMKKGSSTVVEPTSQPSVCEAETVPAVMCSEVVSPVAAVDESEAALLRVVSCVFPPGH